jgi:cytochrome c2
MPRDFFIGALVVAAWAGHALAQDSTAGETAFRKCQPCHDVGEAAKNKLGPDLNGLDGRKRAPSKGVRTATPTRTRESYAANRV